MTRLIGPLSLGDHRSKASVSVSSLPAKQYQHVDALLSRLCHASVANAALLALESTPGACGNVIYLA